MTYLIALYLTAALVALFFFREPVEDWVDALIFLLIALLWIFIIPLFIYLNRKEQQRKIQESRQLWINLYGREKAIDVMRHYAPHCLKKEER